MALSRCREAFRRFAVAHPASKDQRFPSLDGSAPHYELLRRRVRAQVVSHFEEFESGSGWKNVKKRVMGA
jgi:hypothetical protein